MVWCLCLDVSVCVGLRALGYHLGYRRPMREGWPHAQEKKFEQTVRVGGEEEEPQWRVHVWIGNGVLDNSLEDESLLCEFVGAPVSEGGVESLVVEPPHIVVEVGA